MWPMDDPTHERELTAPVDLCDGRGRLDPAARGWSRHPLHLANLRGSPGRKKRWDYWCVISPEVIASVTFADVDYLGLATLWVLDRSSGAQGGGELLAPFARGIELPDEPCTGTMRAAGRGISVEISEAPGSSVLRASGGRGDRAASLEVVVDNPAGHETLSVVIPWSERRYQYTSKHVARPATGTVTLAERTWQLGDDAWGVLDLGRGKWRYANRWNWGTAAGRADDGSVVGVQMGGMWTAGTGFTENALCIDGRLTKLGEELEWTYSWDDPMRPWRVRTPSSDRLDATLVPTFDRHDRTNLGLLKMEVHQVFGTWSGTLRGEDGELQSFAGLQGFAEEARNRW